MLHTFVNAAQDKLGTRTAIAPKGRQVSAWDFHSCWYKTAPLALSACGILSITLLFGCKSTPPPAPAPTAQQVLTPPRPNVPPPAFKVFHHDESSITLVTKENATDDEIESLIWELRDAAHARTLDKLQISQKLVDDRKPIVWFHIYRGTKCAAEKYASGAPPCGGSYHAAGDFTYGGYTNHERDDGALIHDEDHQIQLWNPDIPYKAIAPSVSNP